MSRLIVLLPPKCDHLYGRWAVARAPVQGAPGLLRRRCLLCDSSEIASTRELVRDAFASIKPTSRPS